MKNWWGKVAVAVCTVGAALWAVLALLMVVMMLMEGICPVIGMVGDHHLIHALG